MKNGRSYSYQFFWRAINLNPFKYNYYIDMAVVLYSECNYKEALDVLDMSERIFPDYANACDLMCKIYTSNGDIDKAEKYNKECLKRPYYLSFDDYNKIWTVHERNIKHAPNFNYSSKTHNIVNKNEKYKAKLPKGAEFLKIEASGEVIKCVNEVNLKEVHFNSNTEIYTFIFDKEICSICENKEICISRKADKYGKLSLKKLIIKELAESSNEIETKVSTAVIEDRVCVSKEHLVKELLMKLNEKYGEQFENITKSNPGNQEADCTDFSLLENKNIGRVAKIKFLSLKWDELFEEIQSCVWSKKNLNKFQSDIAYLLMNFEKIATDSEQVDDGFFESEIVIKFQDKIRKNMQFLK